MRNLDSVLFELDLFLAYIVNLYAVWIIVYFIFDILFISYLYCHSYMRISFTERLIVSRASSHLSTVAITMSVRKSDLVRSTSVWSLRPNEIFHRPNQHTSSVLLSRRRRNISLWHKDAAPLRKAVWYRRRIHNFCNWKRSRLGFHFHYARNVLSPWSRVTSSPLSSLFSRAAENTSTLHRSA